MKDSIVKGIKVKGKVITGDARNLKIGPFVKELFEAGLEMSYDDLNITDMVDGLPWHKSKRWKNRSESSINKLVLHQSLGSKSAFKINEYHTAPPVHPKTGVRDIAWGRDWPHGAYHLVVEKDGAIILCNKFTHHTYHTGRPANSTGIGVCLCGNFSGPGYVGKDKPTFSQMVSTIKLAGCLCQKFNISPVNIFGHYDFGKPACPGDIIEGWIAAMKAVR